VNDVLRMIGERAGRHRGTGEQDADKRYRYTALAKTNPT
jgi:hypothetical protein